MKSGMTIELFWKSQAYFLETNCRQKEIGANPYIPVSEMAYKVDEDLYSYNKDSDEWFCVQGNNKIRKVHKKVKSN